MIVIGLTGSIGMGKSTTAEMFRDAGVPVFDADQAVHDLYREDAVPAVEAAFPGVTPGGRVDRAALRTRVLGDPEALRRLESIVHPLVQRKREAFLTQARTSGEPLVVLDLPLLFETGRGPGIDLVVVASAPESVQKARVLARPGMTEEALSAILARQMPDLEKRQRADVVVETGAGFDVARGQVGALLRRLRSEETG